MKLPDKFDLFISEKKIKDYILSQNHSIGKHKARVFYKFGFTRNNFKVLVNSIINLIQEHDINEVKKHRFGRSYVIEGWLKTPSERKLRVRTVWFVSHNGEIATLVTVYPLQLKKSS